MDATEPFRVVIGTFSNPHLADLLVAIADELDARGFCGSEHYARQAADMLHPEKMPPMLRPGQ